MPRREERRKPKPKFLNKLYLKFTFWNFRIYPKCHTSIYTLYIVRVCWSLVEDCVDQLGDRTVFIYVKRFCGSCDLIRALPQNSTPPKQDSPICQPWNELFNIHLLKKKYNKILWFFCRHSPWILVKSGRNSFYLESTGPHLFTLRVDAILRPIFQYIILC